MCRQCRGSGCIVSTNLSLTVKGRNGNRDTDLVMSFKPPFDNQTLLARSIRCFKRWNKSSSWNSSNLGGQVYGTTPMEPVRVGAEAPFPGSRLSGRRQHIGHPRASGGVDEIGEWDAYWPMARIFPQRGCQGNRGDVVGGDGRRSPPLASPSIITSEGHVRLSISVGIP